MILAFGIGIHLILGNLYEEFSTYGKCVFAIISNDFPLIHAYNDVMSGYHHEVFNIHLIQTLVAIFRLFIVFLGCAIIINLYKKAMAFEQGHSTLDPEKKSFYDKVDEIQN